MTPKEALENIINEHNHLLEKYKINGGLGNWYLTVKKALNRLEELEKRDTPIERIQTMMTWQCLNCGKEVRNNWDYCPICGQKLDRSDEK